MTGKGPQAFKTISEVAAELDLPQHVLRFWESRFAQIRPMKRGGGRRYYRPMDVALLRGIRALLYGEGYTIRGVQRILKEHGPRAVVAGGARSEPQRRGRRAEAPPVSIDDDSLELPSIALTASPGMVGGPERVRDVEPLSADDAGSADEDDADGDLGDDAGEADAGHDEDEDDAENDDAEDVAAGPAPRARVNGDARQSQSAPPGRAAAAPQRVAAAGGLGEEDARQLQTTLTELLELKRILDQARG